MKSTSAPFAASSDNAIVVGLAIVISSELFESSNPKLPMNHGGHFVIAQASMPNSAPPSYTTLRGTIQKKHARQHISFRAAAPEPANFRAKQEAHFTGGDFAPVRKAPCIDQIEQPGQDP